MYKQISDYGIIGNSQTVALVGNDGSIDWLCLPSMDSPSVFGALLDENRGGRFSISPAENWDSVAKYLPGTNILVTTFRTRSGTMRLTDFMPVLETGDKIAEKVRSEIYRLIELTRGELEIKVQFAPGFDYGRTKAFLEKRNYAVVARGEKEGLEIYTAETLDEDLTVSGKTFLNAGGVEIDRRRRRVRLSRVFKWYRTGFGKTRAERLRLIAPYLYDEENRHFLEENAEEVQVKYQPYDWRLNRT